MNPRGINKSRFVNPGSALFKLVRWYAAEDIANMTTKLAKPTGNSQFLAAKAGHYGSKRK